MAVTIDGTSGLSGVDGSASTPALQGTDTNTGISFGTDTVNVVTGGSTRTTVDSSGRLLVGTSSSLRSTSLIQAYKSSGTLDCLLDSDSLSDGDVCRFRTDGGNRTLTIGVYKHSGITNPCAFVELACEDGAFNYLWVDNTDVLRISTNASNVGTTGGTVVGDQTSDERLKNVGENVSYGLSEILQLQPKQYALKTDPDTNKLGFIAQEVESIIPEAVFDTGEELEGHQEGDRTKLGMQYVQLIPVLVNAVKE